MIADVLVFLKRHLNTELLTDPVSDTAEASESVVDFIDGGEINPISFGKDRLSMLLVRLERDNTFRAANSHVAVASGNQRVRVAPAIYLYLYVLFVARFSDYAEGLRRLSQVVDHLQEVPTIDRTVAPDLDPAINKLVIELVTPSFSEQRQIWATIGTSYLPSALYRIKLVTFDDPGRPAAPAVTATDSQVVRR